MGDLICRVLGEWKVNVLHNLFIDQIASDILEVLISKFGGKDRVI